MTYSKPGRIIYVDPQDYLDPDRFAPKFYRMADAFRHLKSGDTVKLYGKIDESGLRGPKNVVDVIIEGMNTRTRPGKGGDTAMGGAADWSTLGESTDPLITVVSQGWSFKNIHFGGTIQLSRALDWMESGNHAEFNKCAFSGGKYGIADEGGCTNIGIYGCQFYGFAKDGSVAIKSTSTSFAWPLWWEIVGNRFLNNYGHIQLALSNGIVRDNVFFKDSVEPATPNIISVDLELGKNNSVFNNQFACASTDANYIENAFIMGPGDAWGPNYCSDKTVFGVPA